MQSPRLNTPTDINTTTPERFRTVLLFGAPGSGKGTQGKALGSVPRFFHCACGDVFRQIDTRTRLGQAFLQYSSRGELVPDEISIELWQESILKNVDASRFKPDIDRLVLDGIPRNVNQARLMEAHIQVEKVFHLSCPDRAQLVSRLKKRALRDNRLDDANESVIRRRLETYEAETKPVLEYYGADVVQEIDATQTPVQVLYEIIGGILATPPVAAAPAAAVVPTAALPGWREPMLAGAMPS